MPDPTLPTPGQPRPSGRPDDDPDSIAALALGYVAEIGGRVEQLSTTVDLLPASRRRANARAAVADLGDALGRALLALGGDDPDA
jgi:hypothetical protein